MPKNSEEDKKQQLNILVFKQHLLTLQSGYGAATPLKKRYVGIVGLDGEL